MSSAAVRLPGVQHDAANCLACQHSYPCFDVEYQKGHKDGEAAMLRAVILEMTLLGPSYYADLINHFRDFAKENGYDIQ